MANRGDSYIVTLSQTHLQWGSYRHTSSRGIIYGEGYLPIPSYNAHQFNIYNSNNTNTGLGLNEFNCASSDGLFNGILKSSGCSKKGDIYAKNLHGYGDLKALGHWFEQINAQPGDHIEVRWTSPYDIIISKL